MAFNSPDDYFAALHGHRQAGFGGTPSEYGSGSEYGAHQGFAYGPTPAQQHLLGNSSPLAGDGKGRDGEEEEEDDEEDEDDIPQERGRQRKLWVGMTWCLTWWIPTIFIATCGRMKRPDIQMAWREKVALCLCIFLFSAAIIAFIVVLPILLCPRVYLYAPNEYTYHQGNAGGDDIYMAIYGVVYDVSNFVRTGHGQSATTNAVSTSDMLQYGGKDVSHLFPQPLPERCPGVVQDPLIPLEFNTTEPAGNGIHLSGSLSPVPSSNMAKPNWFQDRVVNRFNSMGYKKGQVAFTLDMLADDAKKENKRWSLIGNEVFDLSNYFFTLTRHPATGAANVPNYAYLGPGIADLFTSYAGQDNTDRFNNNIQPAEFRPALLNCLRNVFKVGVLDTRKSTRCLVSEYLLLSTSIILVIVILAKFLAALQLGSRRSPEDHDKFIICQVPCYTEGEDSLRSTIDSLASLHYDDKRKLIFIICDGNIVGSGNDRPTPRIALDILGVDPKYDPPSRAFKSVAEGGKQLNYGKIYSGLYEHEGHVVPYIVVVKMGNPTEASRPGNRGKRDSQILLLSFLNRIHHATPMSPLELEICHQLRNVIGVDPAFYEYILMVDADTRVMPDSLNRMVSCMLRDSRIIGLCGETQLQNEELSWATMIQVYEYYISHHLAKAFESLFGSVTCLPGCFSIYRIRTSVGGRPVIISDGVIQDY
ncbi:chitin synthase-domain-containing protein, partial [Piptocephalis cylindrospora]